MTNIWKRSMSMFLTLVMVFGMLPLHVLADDDVTPVDTTPTESHEHSYAYACSTVCETCGEGAREASHEYVDGKCACGAIDPDYVAPACEHSYAYACSTVCETCGEGAREASHEYVDGKCACGATDPDYVAPACEHSYAYACSTVCETCGEGAREASHEYVEGKCACGAEAPEYIAPHECVYADGKCETCGADKPASSEEPETVNVSDLAGLLAALASDSELPILVTGQIEIEEDTILDLNGKTVSGTHADAYSMIHVQNGAELTVNGEGTITYAPGGNNTGAAIWVEGALIQNGGTIEVTGEWSFGFAVDLRPDAWGTAHTEPASFVMNDGKIKSTDTAVRVASNSSDDYEELGVSFTMEDGQIESEWDAVFVQHLYASDLDVEIIDGAVSGTNSVLRIYGGSGSDIAMNIKGGSFDGGVKIADDYVDEKPIAITGGTFSADVSAYVADGYVQDADGNVTTAPAEPEVPIVIPENIVDTIVGENAAEEQKADIQAIVDEIAANTALTDESYKPVAHIAGVERLVVTLSGMVKEDTAAPSRITFTVEPKNADGEKVSQPGSSIMFRLPVPASVTHSHAKVFHGNDLMGTFEIKGSGTGKYIEVSSESFSEFTSEFVTPVEEVELPAVTVTDIKPTLTADDPDLTFALNFAIEDLENIQNDQEYLDKLFNTYGRYYTDYVLTISGLDQESVTFNANGSADGYLAGQYDEYGENWLAVPFEDVTVENGNSLYIMAYASKLLNQSGLRFTLEEVAELVQNFDCGVYFTPEFLAANPDMEVTLELKVFTEDAEGNLADDHCVAINKFNVKDIVAVVTGHGKQTEYYTSFAAALTGAEADDTIKLLHNTTENWVTVKKDVTLDLNGCVLEAEYVSCFGSIVDSDAAKGGTLKVEKKKLLIQQSNAMLPVKTAEGYKFVEVKGFNKMLMENGKFVFQPLFEASDHALLAAGVDVTGVTVNVRINWTQDQGARSQGFVYNDEMLTKFVNSYRAETGKYGQMLTLLLKGTDGLADLTYIAQVKSDTGVIIETEGVAPEKKPAEDETGNVTKDENNQVAEQVTITNDDQTSAVVPEGTKLDENTTNLTLVVTEVNESESNITLGKNEAQKSVDVHIEGVASDNAVPMTITLPKFAEAGLNEGNIHIYHVENGETVEMTRVDTIVAFTAHNQYWYDPVTGDVVLYMATFSEITVVSDTVNAWNGNFDYSWYTNAVAPAAEGETADYIIANADQLAAFGAIVGGMNGQTQDSFTDKTVKLIADIDLGYKENADENLIFYPIGYYNSTGSYEKVSGGSVTSSVNSFEGTFDGNGHTIKNFYQNTWEMFGDYNSGYSGTPNHYDDAMGLFGYVVNGTVKNLTVDNFSSDGEFTPTGVIAAYAVNSTFENIAITNCNPRVYNTGNGGIVGIGGNGDDPDTYKLTFNNITIDKTNKITALWGSWDVACGGLVGMFRGAGHVYMTNCHVAAQIDVYNDVCGNYQYYWYRYSGMMVGTNKNMITDKDGYTVPETSKFHAENCTVHFGDWNDYYYCELVANSLASYTHDHQFSRLEQISSVDEIKSGDTWLRSGNFILMNGKTPTDICYHIIKNADGTLKQHLHTDAGEETVNGETVLKENNQRIYLPFNQLFTGYGWGVKHIPVYNGEDYAFEGITILDRPVADSVVKFAKADTAKDSYITESIVTIGELFKAATIADEKLTIKKDKVQVTVSPVGEDSTAGGTYVANTTDWTQGTLIFSGTGAATITITDYYFCKATTISVTITEKKAVEKFETKFTGDFLYRVGNQNEVKLDSLFKEKDGVTIGDVSVTVAPVNSSVASGTYTSNATWTNGTIQFSGTGVVKVTITDNDFCTPTELILEVVKAKNHDGTSAPSATENSVVLLNDVSGGFSVSGGHTVYGNDFTVTLPNTVQSKYSAGYVGYATMSGGNLDNIRVVGLTYTKRNVFREQAKDSDDGTKANYFYNSILINGGNNTIKNSHISGSRTAICIRGGNVVAIDDTTISGGSVANIEIAGASAVTLKDLTTVQTGSTESRGMGVYVTSGVVDLYIEGSLVQNNWVNEKAWDDIIPVGYESAFPKFFENNKYDKHWHYLDGGNDPYVNVGFVFGCNWDTSRIHDNRSVKDYETTDATLNGVSGGVYSKVNTAGSNGIVNDNLNDPGYTAPGFDPVAPVFNFDNTENADEDDANDANDTYCVYNEADCTLKIGVSGDSKTLDLSRVTVTKDGTALTHTAYLNGIQISGNSVTIKAADGAKQTLTFKVTSNDAGYDANGNAIEGSIEYTYTVTIEMAELAYPAPVWNMGGDYQFDTANCYYAYYGTSNGYGEAVPIYEGIKVKYYNKSGEPIELDLSGTTGHPTGSNNSNTNAFTYTLADGSTLTMKFSSGWKSGATTHQFTTYENRVYIYPQSLDNDNYIRAKVTNQDFDVKIAYTFTDPNGQSTEAQTMQWYNAKAGNSNVTTVQWKDFDSTNGKKPSCVTPDTLITLADGTQKRVDELNVADKILAWDFFAGTYVERNISLLVNHGESTYQVANLEFSDGTVLRLIADHGVFDYDLNKFVYITVDNMNSYVGHRFVQYSADGSYNIVTLCKAYETEEVTSAYSVSSVVTSNAFASGMLTVAPPEDFYNWIEMDGKLHYDVEKFNADVEKYGLYTYDLFADHVTYEQFVDWNGAYLKIPVEKGLFSLEYIFELIELYVSYMPN